MTRNEFKKLERGIRWDWGHHGSDKDGVWHIWCIPCKSEFGIMWGKDYYGWTQSDATPEADEAWLENFRPLLAPHVFSPEHQANLTLWILAND